MNHSYNIDASKAKLKQDIDTLLDLYPMKREVFLAGKVIPPVAMAREYNKSICRMHVMIDDLRGNLKTFPHLKKQVEELLNSKTYKKLLSTSTTESIQILNSLKENCMTTFEEFSNKLKTIS